MRCCKIFILLCFIYHCHGYTQSCLFKIGKLKYSGGGDWYANKTALPNLIAFCNQTYSWDICALEEVVDIGSSSLFSYPFVYMTGHGHVLFSPQEVKNLRSYLVAGGFLHIDDNYGLDPFIRKEMKKVFPGLDFIEMPFTHPIYHQVYHFPNGLPKVHAHDGKPPQGLGLVYEGRLVCFYSYESDLGNGWEDQSVYGDSEEVRKKALEMGANIVSYALKEWY